MILISDPISGQLGVQVGLNDYPLDVYRSMANMCDSYLYCAGMFFFRTDAERLMFILKYQGLKKR